METYTIFLVRKNLYCENDYTTQSNIQIHCNPCQIIHSIFHRTRTKVFTICLETQKIPNSQDNLEKVKVKSLSRVRLFATLWTVAYQAPLSMGFPRQENVWPFPILGDLPHPEIEPVSPALAGGFFTT